tara:strand:- start:3668 stop:3907 length:240 start_codon:yes stop_codon:yes gene_type:complete
MTEQEKIVKQFKDSITEMTKNISGFSQQFEKISKESEKNLTEKESKIIEMFKEESKKSTDFSSLIKLKEFYEQKLKDAI